MKRTEIVTYTVLGVVIMNTGLSAFGVPSAVDPFVFLMGTATGLYVHYRTN